MNFAKPITGRTVLYAMLAFFGVIFAVNGSFLYFALSSFPGLSTNQAYEKGISFNKTLADVEKQKEIGWKNQITATKDGTVRLMMENRAGEPLQGLEVKAVLMRPLNNDNDQNLAFTEYAPGRYQATVATLNPGQWRLEMSAQKGNQTYFKVHSMMVEK